MRISDWSSDVCSSDLSLERIRLIGCEYAPASLAGVTDDANIGHVRDQGMIEVLLRGLGGDENYVVDPFQDRLLAGQKATHMNVMLIDAGDFRSEEHTSELQSLMRISYAVFCLKKKKQQTRYI